MGLVGLPNELHLEIAKYLGKGDYGSLVKTDRSFYCLLNSELYKTHATHRAHGAYRTYGLGQNDCSVQIALRWAVDAACADTLKLCLKHSKPEQEDICYAMAKVVEIGGQSYEKIVEMLLDHGDYAGCLLAPKRPMTALQCAAMNGHDSIVRRLLDAGADTKAPMSAHSRERWSTWVGWELYRSALIWACSQGHESTARLLLDRGSDVNENLSHLGDDGTSPLIEAIYSNHVNIIGLLMDRGATLTGELRLACLAGSEDAVRMLLAKGADPDKPKPEQHEIRNPESIWSDNISTCTNLMATVVHGREGVVRLLLQAGARVNEKHRLFGTALQQAVNLSRRPYSPDDSLLELCISSKRSLVFANDEDGMVQRRIVGLLLAAGATL